MVNITITNNCRVSDCPKNVMDVAKKSLTIENPAYHRVARITGNAWAAARDFKYYRAPKGINPNGEIIFPRGFAKRFTSYLEKNNIQYEQSSDFVSIPLKDVYKWKPVDLRDYQKPLVKAMVDNESGVLYAGTGTGKTVCACELTRLLGKTVTILCPTTIIQQQFVAEFRKWFGYEVGVVGNGKKDVKPITVAMWQSLSADKDLADRLAAQTSILIADEVHTAISDERRKILELFKPSRIYGLSGSPRRSKDDGRTEAIFFYFGGIIAKHEMTQVTPDVEIIRTGVNIPVDDYPIMVDSLVSNASRNTLIAGLASGEMMSGKKVLVLLKRREHCSNIMALLPQTDLVWYADSDNKDRNDVLMAMRAGERDFCVLVGTFSLLGAGLDLPMLDVLIIGGDLKSDVLTQQGSGRVLRLFEGKESAKIYDLYDNKNPIFKRQFYERLRFYQSKQWNVVM